MLLTGCHDTEEPIPQLSLDKERIVFDNPAEGAAACAALHLDADRPWSVRYHGNGHDCRVSVTAGDAGAHDLVVETAEANDADDLSTLGKLVFSLADGSASRTVDLVQRPRMAQQTLLMYFCGSDLYYYYKNNLSDVARALTRNILPQGRIVAFTQPASGEGYVVEYRYDETTNACRRDTLIRYTPARRPLDRSRNHGTHSERHGGRSTGPPLRPSPGLARKRVAARLDREFVVASQRRPTR